MVRLKKEDKLHKNGNKRIEILRQLKLSKDDQEATKEETPPLKMLLMLEGCFTVHDSFSQLFPFAYPLPLLLLKTRIKYE